MSHKKSGYVIWRMAGGGVVSNGLVCECVSASRCPEAFALKMHAPHSQAAQAPDGEVTDTLPHCPNTVRETESLRTHAHKHTSLQTCPKSSRLHKSAHYFQIVIVLPMYFTVSCTFVLSFSVVTVFASGVQQLV